MRFYNIFFSPTGGTEKVADIVAKEILVAVFGNRMIYDTLLELQDVLEA